MSHRIFRILFLIVPIGLILAFLFRPTPIVGVDGESLAHSTGVDADQLSLEPCVQEGEDEWKCSIPPEGEGEATVVLLDLDWQGCWKAEVLENGSVDPPVTGCVTVMDHIESID